MDIISQTQILVNSRILRTENEVQQFENAIANILNLNDVDHIKNLCLGFDDATEHDEVMFSLIHAIESYDKTFGPEVPLQKLADSINGMLPHARGWVETLHKRILNHDLSRRVYAEVISNCDTGIKDTVLQLINGIKAKNPKKFEASVSEFFSNIK
ncbi:Imm30 family immunity protein [Paenibacillus harenae]|uniref:Immunity protein 30 domain-containing protein n=1 Tax=Paenibacillus harenae TaxID=306543 RepID=A0ABT9TTK7_PAEHA|nr:Imm30 family immunity protein [Paenibacillus harenae]MDQ0110676.1 hypothetical protein [Paenibacillus harenae]